MARKPREIERFLRSNIDYLKQPASQPAAERILPNVSLFGALLAVAEAAP